MCYWLSWKRETVRRVIGCHGNERELDVLLVVSCKGITWKKPGEYSHVTLLIRVLTRIKSAEYSHSIHFLNKVIILFT